MTTTFNASLDDPISRVRQYIGDTDVSAAKIQDETIVHYLRTGGLTELRAAAQLCRDLAARYADRVNTTFDRELTGGGDLYRHYLDMAATLEKRAAGQAAQNDATGFCGVTVGGVSDCAPWSPSDPWSQNPWRGRC